MPQHAVFAIDSGTGARRVRLAEYLDAHREETALTEANAWIKRLRHARVDGRPFRDRFTYRDDSLWWFAELFLHKERQVLHLYRAILAMEHLIEREQPLLIRFVSGSPIVKLIAPQVARERRIRYEGPKAPSPGRRALLRMDVRSAGLAIAARLSKRRPRKPPSMTHTTVAAFVHTAFWKTDTADGSAEAYIGPVLQALERRIGSNDVTYVGVGPSTNFRARRWWRAGGTAPSAIVPVESFAPIEAMRGSWNLWRERHAMRRALWNSEDLRRAAIVRGCDCWPVVRHALAGIALLQFPWSARAMDEAAAAYGALSPRVAVTYAEAGGWGRALALEARRRGIPFVGLQHGFIYRHWLNYRHEADEMEPSRETGDRGFPRPDLTLLFDEYAAQHLADAGRFPRRTIAVTGSPRLDVLAGAFRALTPEDAARVRNDLGVAREQALAVVVAKFTEIRAYLPDLMAAARDVPGLHVAIKTHPAETPELYAPHVAAGDRARVLPASSPLAPLLRAADVVITVNSTVALDALVLGVPALSIGLPNNLSPFVAAGAMAGVESGGEIAQVLQRVVYDREFRQQLTGAGAALAAEYRLAPDGAAAERSADAILGMIDRKD